MSNTDTSMISFTAAAIQMSISLLDVETNLNQSLELMTSAVAAGARLLVLPELCTSGYVFDDRNELDAVAEDVPNGIACQAWIHFAAKNNVYISAGIPERHEDKVYNSAVLIGPAGLVSRDR